MRGVVADVHMDGWLHAFLRVWEAEPWQAFWADLHLPCHTFADLAWPTRLTDWDLWVACQRDPVETAGQGEWAEHTKSWSKLLNPY